MSATYSDKQRLWALETYRTSRNQYKSRMECCTDIAAALGAHVNTVTRWVNDEFGRARALTTEEIPERIATLQAEVKRLRNANRILTESRQDQ